jgi:hypothetical protein
MEKSCKGMTDMLHNSPRKSKGENLKITKKKPAKLKGRLKPIQPSFSGINTRAV